MAGPSTAPVPQDRPRELLAGLSPVGRGILGVAREIVSEGGLEALSLQAIAARLGVRKSAIGYHFGSKEGLILSLAEVLFEAYPGSAAERPAAVSDPAERLALRFGMLRKLATDRQYRKLAYALQPLTQQDESSRARAQELKDDDLRRVAVALGLREDDAATLAPVNVLDAAIAGLALNYTFGRHHTQMDACLDRLEEALTPLFLEVMKGVESG